MGGRRRRVPRGRPKPMCAAAEALIAQKTLFLPIITG